jgi:hypothetical protein
MLKGFCRAWLTRKSEPRREATIHRPETRTPPNLAEGAAPLERPSLGKLKGAPVIGRDGASCKWEARDDRHLHRLRLERGQTRRARWLTIASRDASAASSGLLPGLLRWNSLPPAMSSSRPTIAFKRWSSIGLDPTARSTRAPMKPWRCRSPHQHRKQKSRLWCAHSTRGLENPGNPRKR